MDFPIHGKDGNARSFRKGQPLMSSNNAVPKPLLLPLALWNLGDAAQRCAQNTVACDTQGYLPMDNGLVVMTGARSSAGPPFQKSKTTQLHCRSCVFGTRRYHRWQPPPSSPATHLKALQHWPVPTWVRWRYFGHLESRHSLARLRIIINIMIMDAFQH